MNSIEEVRGLLIDMDGVLWRGRTFLPGVRQFFSTLRERQLPFLLVTNNATVSPQSAVERLAEIQVEIEPQEVLTSAFATAAYLKTVLSPGASVYAIGEQAVRHALEGAGFHLLDQHDSARAVVVGFDRQIDWYKMAEAALAIQAGALFVGTNPDVSFPIEGGQAPGNGAFVRAIEVSTGVEPVIVGKPEPLLFEQAIKTLDLPAEQTLMIGDRLETDILGAQRAGVGTALMLSGVTSKAQLASADIKPDFIFEDLPELTDRLESELR